jgi:outer membrane protein
MQKTTFLLLFCLACTGLHAQTEVGRFLLGSTTRVTPGIGGVGLSFGNTIRRDLNTDNKVKSNNFSFNINPSIGYFVGDGIAIGLNVGYGFARDYQDDVSFNTSLLSVVPFIRYYLPGQSKVRPFVGLSGTYNLVGIKLTSNNDTERESTDLFGWGAEVGAAFFINDKISLDLFLDYNRDWTTEEDEFFFVRTRTRTINNRFGLGVGFTFFL